jgi:exodeoxyribonuclease-3
LKCATFNANSVRARMPVLQEWLGREQPDVLFLQETKVQDDDFPEERLAALGYRAVYRGQKSYNGVAILTRGEAREVRRALQDGRPEEARFLDARVGDVRLINVYVPQGQAVGSEPFAYKLRWLDDLQAHLRRDCRPDEALLLAGDFNVALTALDVHDPEGLKGQVCFHPEEQSRMKAILDWGLEDLLRSHHPEGGLYTFWDYRIPNAFKRRVGWRIDYLLATPPLAEKCRRVWIDTAPRLQPKPSDHTFLVAEFE